MISGLIGELVTGRADLIVAPLTINPERAQVVMVVMMIVMMVVMMRMIVVVVMMVVMMIVIMVVMMVMTTELQY